MAESGWVNVRTADGQLLRLSKADLIAVDFSGLTPTDGHVLVLTYESDTGKWIAS